MKITVNQLRRIIKEEVQRVMEGDWLQDSAPKDWQKDLAKAFQDGDTNPRYFAHIAKQVKEKHHLPDADGIVRFMKQHALVSKEYQDAVGKALGDEKDFQDWWKHSPASY